MVTLEEMKKLEAVLPTLPLELRGTLKKLLADYDRLKKEELRVIGDLPGEIWRDVTGYEGLYHVSNLGRVKSLHNNKEYILKPRRGKKGKGYFDVSLCKNGKHKTFRLNRLVALAFVDNPENKPEVDHIDTNKTNNRANNLRWVTSAENIAHSIENGLYKSGAECSWAKLTEDDVRYIRKVYTPKHPEFGKIALARKFGVCTMTIYNITSGKRYKNVK